MSCKLGWYFKGIRLNVFLRCWGFNMYGDGDLRHSMERGRTILSRKGDQNTRSDVGGGVFGKTTSPLVIDENRVLCEKLEL